MDRMFAIATRRKLRFATAIGALDTESLWDLPLTHATKPSLDNIAKDLNRQIKASEEESFVDTKPTIGVEDLETKFEIVKYIIGAKIHDRDAAKSLADRKATRERVMAIIAKKDDEAL